MQRTVILQGAALILAVVGSLTLIAQSDSPRPAGRTAAPSSSITAPSTSSSPAPALDADKVDFDHDIVPIFNRYCTQCHGTTRPRAGLSLTFKDEEQARSKLKEDDTFWDRVATEVSTRQMPPAGRPAPTEAERELLTEWVYNSVMTTDGKPDPGPFMVRRLNNRQYANTLRDLLYLPDDYNAAADFPPDERGDGFDNNAGTLTISPLLIENYLQAAEKATVTALGLDPKMAQQLKDATLAAKNKLNEPSEGFCVDFADRQEKIRLNLKVLAPRAYRRPVSDAEIDELMKFAALSFAHAGESFDQATGLAVRAAVMSPEFLFHMERDPNPDGTGKVFEISEYELASRLSYFLWSTMPDEQLSIAARDGVLRSTLGAQLERMLQDPKAISLTRDFMGQWLEIRGLHEVTNAPAPLLESMRGETERFFDYIIRNDRSIMEFLDADYTFVNETMAKLYGIPGIIGDDFQKVQVDKSKRGGVFTQASFLTLTSKPLGNSRRTSPVVRGKWILENIFNERIPPPPPDVPSIDFDPNKELKGTVRQIFEQHRADPACAGCHARMDPYGFALENYDGFGAWRETDNNVKVDASGEIRGQKFVTPSEFRVLLAGRQDDFRRAFIRKMLSYALGRGLRASDRQTVESIAVAVKADGDRFSSIVANIAASYPFQHARGMKGQDAAPTSSAATTLYHPVPSAPLFEPQPEPPPGGRRCQPPTIQGQKPNQEPRPSRGQGAGTPPAAAPDNRQETR